MGRGRVYARGVRRGGLLAYPPSTRCEHICPLDKLFSARRRLCESAVYPKSSMQYTDTRVYHPFRRALSLKSAVYYSLVFFTSVRFFLRPDRLVIKDTPSTLILYIRY